MKEPSEKDIKKEKQSELDKIADMNAKCVAGYQIIRNTVFNGIEDADLVKMNKYITVEYGKVYTGLKGMIIDALNDAKDKNVKLVEKLLDTSLPPAKHYDVLPKTTPFKYTNRVFTEKSVSIRSQKAADSITKIIADGRNEGLAIKDIQKKIDTVMGFRDAQGRLTDKSKKLIESGRFAHRNGSIYETYRIARTETMRMNSFAKYDEFLELRKTYPNARLKLKATLDGREREQSREMNEQVSTAMGLFLYPDGKYYRLGTAPAKYCINDREVQYIVFLSEKEEIQKKEELRELKEEKIQITEDNTNDEIKNILLNADNSSIFEEIKKSYELIEQEYNPIGKEANELQKYFNATNQAQILNDEILKQEFISKCKRAQELNNLIAQYPQKKINATLQALRFEDGGSIVIGGTITKGVSEVAQNLRNDLKGIINKDLIKNTPLEISYTNEKRKYFSNTTNKLYLNNKTDRAIALHEAMHWLEHNNKNVGIKSIKFLEYRTQNESIEILRTLTKNNNYKLNEVAKKDKFFNPYCGKIYAHNNSIYATEILSMGLERLTKDPINFYNEDPEYVNFIIGVLRGQI